MEPVALTLGEIRRQPDTWALTLERVHSLQTEIRTLLAGRPTDLFLFAGCGSSYYLAQSAAVFFQEITGWPARAVPASELILSPRSHLLAGQRSTLIVFSRSGETTETLVAVRQHRVRQLGPTLAFTCRDASTLGSVVDLEIALPWADDRSVVMTSSFTSMLLGAIATAALSALDRPLWIQLQALPALLDAQMDRQEAFSREIGQNLDLHRFVFLGLGPFFGVASEGMLKIKEMTQVACETYSPLEFRHGPISIIDPGSMAVLLGSDRARRQEAALLQMVAELGGKTTLLDGSPEPGAAHHLLAVGERLPEPMRALLYVPILQLLAYQRAMAAGRDPDRPRHLTQVVRLAEADLLA